MVSDGTDPNVPFAFNTTGASVIEQGSNPLYEVFWVRWSSGWSVDLNGSPVAPVGHAHAIHATAAPVASVPATGMATYTSLIGGTSPTMNHASNPSITDVGTHSVSMTVDFGTATVSASVNGTFAGNSVSYNASGSGFLDSFDPNFGHFDLSGSCFGGPCITYTPLFGGSEFALFGSGAAAAGVYDLKDSSGNIGIVGTYLVTP